MKKSLVGGIGLLAVFLVATPSFAISYGFQSVTNNLAGDASVAEAQLVLDVTDNGDGRVRFTFSNLGPAASSITDIYFDDDAPVFLTNSLDILSQSSGVDFGVGATPGNLPSGNTIGFQTSAGLATDSNAPAQPNGVNPGQQLVLALALLGSSDFADVIAAIDANLLRVGIHVQGFDSGGSESLVSNPRPPSNPVPEPSAALVFGAGSLVLVARNRRARRLESRRTRPRTL
jgi:hypothetical protein